MRTFVQIAFYTWVVASLVGLVIYRRRQAAAKAAAEDVGAGTASPGTDGIGLPAAGSSQSGTATVPTAAAFDPLTPSRPVAPVVPRELLDAPPVRPPEGATPDSTRPVASGDRRGLFAAGASSEPVTIAQALEGVTWPCGLTPVIRMQDLHQADRRVVFSTIDVPAAEVGRQVADALETAGFAVTSLDDATILARRGGVSVAVVLHPEAGKVHTAGQPEFPTLPPASVVLVCDLRSG